MRLSGTLVLLCTFGFFRDFTPSEPYMTEYIIGFKGVDNNSVYHEIYPVWSYSTFALLVPAFLLTDLLLYKPLITLQGLAYIGWWSTMLCARSVAALQGMEVMYGLATATDVAYVTYIYARVPEDEYEGATALTRTAVLAGRSLACVLAQVMESTNLMDYEQVNYVSLCSVTLAFVISLFLPPVDCSMYFHRKGNGGGGAGDALLRAKAACATIFSDARSSYGRAGVVKWSLWVAVSTCLYNQLGNYVQPLWEEIRPSRTGAAIYNGAVEAATLLLGALLVFAVGFTEVDWKRAGDGAVLLVSVVGGGVFVGMGLAGDIRFAYFGYVLLRASYQTMMTVASFEIAKQISGNAYALVFGINNWLALLLQTVLTAAVADGTGLALSVADQFVVYGGIYIVCGVLFIARRHCRTENDLSQQDEKASLLNK